jgi:hypothetical protein
LLESFVFSATFGYWQPGDWFKWAYVDQSTTVTTVIGNGSFNVNPNRGIDPLIGFQGSVLFQF